MLNFQYVIEVKRENIMKNNKFLSSLKYASLIALVLFDFLSVSAQPVRISYSKYEMLIPLLEIKDSSLCTLLDTVLFYKNKCVFARKGIIHSNQISLFKSSDTNKLSISYYGSPNYEYLDILPLPAGCFFYKKSLFLISLLKMDYHQNKDLTDLIENQFDSLFFQLDSNYLLTYDMDDFQYFFRSNIERDALKIRFIKENDIYTIISKETCIENKKDLYIPPKSKDKKRNLRRSK